MTTTTWPRSRECLIASSIELDSLVKAPQLHEPCPGRRTWGSPPVTAPQLHEPCSGQRTWVSPPVDEPCLCPCGHPNRKAA